MPDSNADQNLDNLGEGNMSLADIVAYQEILKKDFDSDKPDNELTPEQLAKKKMYFVIDKIIEEKIGPDEKKNLDGMRGRKDSVFKFQAGIDKLIEVGKEAERHFLWQSALLSNHFDHGKENYYYVVTRRMTDELVNSEMPNAERLELAKKILGTIKVYREKLVSELKGRQEIITALVASFENNLNQVNFDSYIKILEGDSEGTHKLESQMIEWMSLSKGLLKFRNMAIEAVVEDVDTDEILPKHVIQSEGDVKKKVSGIDMVNKGERVVRLTQEASKAEKEIGEKREKAAEELFGKMDTYINFPKEDTNSQKEARLLSHENPLQSKAWFRFMKVIYVGAYVLSLLLGILILVEIGDLGFWFVIGTIIIFSIIKKAFYYVTIGKISWK